MSSVGITGLNTIFKISFQDEKLKSQFLIVNLASDLLFRLEYEFSEDQNGSKNGHAWKW